MSDDYLTETLLEMHFHRAIVNYFANEYGVNFLRLLKPSTQQEVWVGFDQGWVYTSLTTRDLLKELQSSIQAQTNSVDHFYLGFFLRFKRVKKMTRKSKSMPDGYTLPYYRSELSVKPNRRTKLSQHETLLRLNKLNTARVTYACALLFDLDEIYEPPNLDRLRCVDISTSPDGWATNERHFITFQSEMDSNSLWCSDPVAGKSLSFREWASPNSQTGPQKLTAQDISNLLQSSVNVIRLGHSDEPHLTDEPEHPIQLPMFDQDSLELANFIPESFNLIEFGPIQDETTS